MEIKKAKSQQQKLHRTNTILDAAEHLFVEAEGELPSVIQIANQAELAKGTVYLYFKTKEGIFLTLLERHLQKWLQDLDKQLRRYEQHSAQELCEYLSQYWVSHPNLAQLYRISDAVLEANVDDKTYAGFNTRKINEIKRVVPALQELNSLVSTQEWAELISTTIALLGSAWVMNYPQSGSALDREKFKQDSVRLLTPFWQANLEKQPEQQKPKSAWRKLLGN